jgi:hypothetical protein
MWFEFRTCPKSTWMEKISPAKPQRRKALPRFKTFFASLWLCVRKNFFAFRPAMQLVLFGQSCLNALSLYLLGFCVCSFSPAPNASRGNACQTCTQHKVPSIIYSSLTSLAAVSPRTRTLNVLL